MDSRAFLHVLAMVLAAATAAACARATGVVAVPGAGDGVVGRGVLTAVRAAWPEAELTSAAPMACPAAAPPPAVLRADINGDGEQDVIVGVVDGDATRLVVAFGRLSGEYLVVETGDGLLRTPLAVEIAPRGSSYQLEELTVDNYFGTDTVVSRGCDGQRTAWLWTGQTFRPARLGP